MQPYNLSFADERPVRELPDIALWSENYAFVGYDYQTCVGWSAYVGRWVKNPKLWREQLYLYLPDGTVLLHLAIGRANEIEVPTGGSLRFHCDQPGGAWRIEFEGAMRHHDLATLLREPIVEATPHPVTLNIELTHDYPVWMLPSSNNTSYGKFHYEQMGECRGSFSFGGKSYAFKGPTYRDHTRGPRHLGGFQGHCWLQLHFENGPQFSTYQAWAETGGGIKNILNESVSIRPGSFGDASIDNPPLLTSTDMLFDPFPIDVTIEGKSFHLQATPLATMITSLSDEFDFFHGFPSSIADIVATEQPLRIEGAGDGVTGYVQRSSRLPRRHG